MEFARIAVLLAQLTAAADVSASGPACAAVCADRVTALQVPAPADRWLGNDKFRHFWMSYATTAFTFAAVRAAGGDTDAALMVALPVGAVAGVGKEIHDRRRGGPFSLKDLVADALGLAAAYFLLREVQ